MPIIISGYLTIDARKLREKHEGHDLRAYDRGGRMVMTCIQDDEVMGEEPAPRTDLYCGCTDQSMHDDGAAMIAKWRKQYRIPKSSCVGCYMGDNGIPFHECAVHG